LMSGPAQEVLADAACEPGEDREDVEEDAHIHRMDTEVLPRWGRCEVRSALCFFEHRKARGDLTEACCVRRNGLGCRRLNKTSRW
jgi:hypothetical protein